MSPPLSVTSLENQGYLIVKSDRKLREATKEMFRLGNQFFAKPQAEKSRNFSSQLFEGYRDIGIEFSETPDRPDLSESFSVRTKNARACQEFMDEDALHLREVMEHVICGMQEILETIVDALTNHFSEDRLRNRVFSCDQASHLQLNYYQSAASERHLLQDRHEDALLLTLTCATAPGLEVERRDGTFVPLNVTPGSVLIMPGEIAALLSGYKISPLYHRVRRFDQVGVRQSVMYFANPNPDSDLAPWCVNEHNRDVDILNLAMMNPKRFGLPEIE